MFITPLFKNWWIEHDVFFVRLTCHRKFLREYTSDSAEPFSDWSSEPLKIFSPELQAKYIVAAYSKCHCASHFTPWSNQLIHRVSFASSLRRWIRPRLQCTVGDPSVINEPLDNYMWITNNLTGNWMIMPDRMINVGPNGCLKIEVISSYICTDCLSMSVLDC